MSKEQEGTQVEGGCYCSSSVIGLLSVFINIFSNNLERNVILI